LHIPGTNLKDIGILGYQTNIVRVYHFGDYRYAELLPDSCQQFQPGFLQTLKTERGSTWFKGTTTQDAGSGIFYCPDRPNKLLFILHSTGPGHNYDTLTPNLNPINGNQAVLCLEFPGGELVGLHNPGYAFHPGEHSKALCG